MKQSERVRQASEIPIGGSEQLAKDRVKELFKVDKSKCKFKDMSADELAYFEEQMRDYEKDNEDAQKT